MTLIQWDVGQVWCGETAVSDHDNEHDDVENNNQNILNNDNEFNGNHRVSLAYMFTENQFSFLLFYYILNPQVLTEIRYY